MLQYSDARLAAGEPLLQVIIFIIRLPCLPELPDNRQPAIGQAAIGVAVRSAVRTHLLPVGPRPGRLPRGGHRPLLGHLTELMIAGFAELDHPALLEVLELAGCIVTLDALGTQTQIAGTIVAKDGDYVLALKEN